MNFDQVPNQPEQFRELPQYQMWGADLYYGAAPVELLQDNIIDSVNATSIPCFGYFVLSEMRYHITAYQRNKYGIVQPSNLLALSTIIHESIAQSSLQVGDVEITGARVVLGLERGYGSEELHSLETVQHLYGGAIRMTPCEIFSVRPGMDPYLEQAVLIHFPMGDLQKIYQLGYQLGQERFSVENFETQSAWLVETPHCKEPDSM